MEPLRSFPLNTLEAKLGGSPISAPVSITFSAEMRRGVADRDAVGHDVREQAIGVPREGERAFRHLSRQS